jgi:OOP family OmpA-OmpF porin
MNGRTASCLRCWFLGLLLVMPASRGFAQATFVNKSQGMDAHLFRPAVDSKGFISVNGTSVLGDRDYSFGLVLDGGFGIFPLRSFSYDPAKTPANADRNTRLINAAVTGTLHFNYGLGNLAVVGLQLPIMIVNGPNTIIPGAFNDTRTPAGIDSQGIGNLTLHGKLRILRSEAEPIGLAAILQIELPTGNAAQFRGDPGFSLWPLLAADWVPVPAFRLGINAGYRWNAGRSPSLPFQGRIDPVTNPGTARRR